MHTVSFIAGRAPARCKQMGCDAIATNLAKTLRPDAGYNWKYDQTAHLVTARSSYATILDSRVLRIRRCATFSISEMNELQASAMTTLVLSNAGPVTVDKVYGHVLAGRLPEFAASIVRDEKPTDSVAAIFATYLGPKMPDSAVWLFDDMYCHSDLEAIRLCEEDLLRVMATHA